MILICFKNAIMCSMSWFKDAYLKFAKKKKIRIANFISRFLSFTNMCIYSYNWITAWRRTFKQWNGVAEKKTIHVDVVTYVIKLWSIISMENSYRIMNKWKYEFLLW